MKKLIILFLLAFTFVNAQIELDGGLHKVPSLWKLSGTTLSPISSTWSLSGITNIGLSGNLVPAVTNTSVLGSADYIWNTGYLGTLTLGDDSDNVSGQLNFIASDNDQGNIAINTSDQLTFNSFNGYLFDNPLYLGATSKYITGSGSDIQLFNNAGDGIVRFDAGTFAMWVRFYDENNTGDNDRYTSLRWLADSTFVIDLDYTGSKTQRPMSFTGFTSYTFDRTLILSGNISANAWTTNGIGLVRQAGTFTDLTSSGTVANAYTNVLGGNTIAASNSTTFTNYFTTYINAPVAGTNVTITNPYALGVGGNTLQTGNLSVQSSLTTDERVVTLADSASISIATGVAGFGRVMIGDNQEEAEIKWKADGTVTLIRNSTNVASDGTTDDTLNIYDGGSGIVIKNLLGSQLKLAISLKYYTP